ncbi:MAG: biotin synthase, partial [Marmoricola sp.]|nr:biotin synthase [Marmoricola sp.]
MNADILAIAREQVLERGVPLDEAQILRVMQTSDAALSDLLALAHEVRMT